MLHRVVWPSNQTVGNLIDPYYRYIQKHYGPNESLLIVFDGCDEDELKAAERRRRYVKKSPEIVFGASIPMSITQDSFLANSANKTRFVSLLSNYLRERHIDVLAGSL